MAMGVNMGTGMRTVVVVIVRIAVGMDVAVAL